MGGPTFPHRENLPPRFSMRAPRDDLFTVEPVMPIPPGPPALERAMPNGSFERQVAGETTLFVSNLPNAADHKVRFLLEQLTGPVVNFRKEGRDGWLKYENLECAKIAYDILRERRIEGIRLVVEYVSDKNPAPVTQVKANFTGQSGSAPWSQKPKIEGSPRGSRDRMWDGQNNLTEGLQSRPRTADAEGLQRKLFVGNLTFDTNKFDLHRLFSKYGRIDQIILPKKDGGPSGYGFIFFNSNEEASNAVRFMNGFDLRGRRLRVELATSKGRKDDGSGPSKKRNLGGNARGMGTGQNPGPYNSSTNTPFSDPGIFSNPSQVMQGYGQY